MTPQRSAYVYALSAVVLWSSVGTAFKLTLRHMAPFQLVFVACAVSLVVLGAVLTVQGKWSLVRGLTRREVGFAALLGMVSPFAYYVALFMAYARLPAQVAQPIAYTWAVMLALLSVPVLKQKLSKGEMFAMIVSYMGVVVIATGGKFSLDSTGISITGVALALLSTVLWAGYWIANTYSRLDPVLSLLLNVAFALPCVFVLTLLTDGLPHNMPLSAWLGAVYVGTFEMGIAAVLWLMAMRLTESTARVATLIFLAPFLSLVWFTLILEETIAGATLVGLVFVVGGSALQQRFTQQKHEKHAV